MDVVVVHGLTRHAHFNGRVGRIVEHRETRFVVELDCSKQIAVRFENLRRVPDFTENTTQETTRRNEAETEVVSEDLSGSSGRPPSCVPPPAAVRLEHEVGTVLDVTWADGETYRGSVKAFDEKRQQSLMHYPCDGKQRWHNFDKDACTFKVVEPAAHTLATLRKTKEGYDGQVVPGARWYAMSPDYIEAHFRKTHNEGAWLDTLGTKFKTVPQGAKRRRVAEVVSEDLSGSSGRPPSRVPPPAAVRLEREVGTVLDVTWADGETYQGSVKDFDEKRQQSLMHYPCDGKQQWHDFDKDACTFKVVEPAAHTLATLRRTEEGYDGQVDPTGRWYAMSPNYIENHFRKTHNESAWLDTLGTKFKTVPPGAKRRRVADAPAKKMPYCVLGSLAKALRHVGNPDAAARVEADFEASLTQLDRFKYAAGQGHKWGLEARKVKGGTNALEWRSEHPTLLQVSRTHAVAVCNGLLFDHNEAQQLPLTRANLDRCIGAPYVDHCSRGYEFHSYPSKKRKSLE